MADELREKAGKIYQALGKPVHIMLVDKHTFQNTRQYIRQ